MLLLERRFTAARPKDAVWRELSAVELWPRWARHISAVRLLPQKELAADSTGEVVLAIGIRSRFRVTRFDPGDGWSWQGKFLWLVIDYDHRLEALPSGEAEVLFRVEATGVFAGSLGRLFAAVYARDLDHAIPRLVAMLTSGTEPGA